MISGLMSAVGAIMAFKNSYDVSAETTTDSKIMDAVNKVVTDKRFPLMLGDGHMIRFASNFVVEPVIIVTKDVNREDIVQRVMELNTDIFCSFYMQTFDLLKNMYGLDTMSAISLLSTNDDTVLGKAIKTAGGHALANYNSIKNTAMGHEVFSSPNYKGFSFGLEAVDVETGANDDYVDMVYGSYLAADTASKKVLDEKLNAKPATPQEMFTAYNKLPASGQKAFEDAMIKVRPQTKGDIEMMKHSAKVVESHIGRKEQDKDSLLSTILFRNFEVTISAPVGGNPVRPNEVQAVFNFKLPITVKAHVIVCDADDLANMIAPNGDDKGFFARWEDYRSGAIGFKDLLFAGDLIQQYKENKLKDKNKLIELLDSRANSAAAKTINYNAASKTVEANAVGFEKYYNMIIFSSDDKIIIEKAIGGKLSDRKYVEKFLRLTGGLLYSQVDLSHERVDIEMGGKVGHSTVDFKTLQKKRNNGAQDFSEILKALMMNRPPVF